MKTQEPFQIWDERFSVGGALRGWIYKIYFKNYSQHCYIGITPNNDSPSIKTEFKTLKKWLWKAFSGISLSESLSSNYSLTEEEYQNLTLEQRESYDRKIALKRKAKIIEFQKDETPLKEWHFWKMMMFMDLNHLRLKDLRIELLDPIGPGQYQLYDFRRVELVKKYDSYFQGFNSTLILDAQKYGKQTLKSSNLLWTMRKTLKTSKNEFLKFNCWWYLYRHFQASFELKPLVWMAFWKKVEISQVVENFNSLTQFLFQKKKKSQVPSLSAFPHDMIEFMKQYPNENAKVFLNNYQSIPLKSKVDVQEWIKNDAFYFIKATQADLIEEQQILDFFGSWEEIKNFFQKTPSQQESGFEKMVQPGIDKMMQQINDLKDYEKSLRDYNDYWKLSDTGHQELVAPIEKTLLFDFYFTKNFLNAIIFTAED